MKDELENFINQNRNAFDDKEPSQNLWKGIERSLKLSERTSVWNSVTLWRAAAIVFMVLSVYLLIPKKEADKNTTVAMKEFTDVEQFYIEQISEKTEMIQEFQRNDGMNGFTNDFQQLEAMYMVLKEEMKSSPSQKVKDALVLNLLVRIDLLNQQLHKLDKVYKSEEPKKAS